MRRHALFVLLIAAVTSTGSETAAQDPPATSEQVSPGSVLAIVRQAQVRGAAGAWDEAARLWAQAVEQNPVQPAWWYSLGEARSRSRDYANAIPAFERAAALGAPLMGGYYAVYEVARCYALAGDTERGIEALQRAFRLGFPDVRQVIRDPDLAALRRDSRVIDMLGLQDVSAMSRDDGWRYDLTIFAREAYRKGFNTHLSVNRPVTREQFDAKVRDIRDAIPRLSDGQVVLEFIKLARFLEDGHSEVLWDFGDNPLLQPTLPLAFFWFDDGLFVTASDPEHRDLLGAQVLQVDDLPVQDVLNATSPYINVDRGNPMIVKAKAPYALRKTAVLHAAGLVRSPDRVTLAIRDLSGDTRDVVVHADSTEPDIWNKLPAPSGWETFTSTLTSPPLYVQHTDKPQWFEYMPDQKTVYFQFNKVRDGADESLLRFTTRLSAFIDSNDVDRLVIDMRWNNGGNTSAAHPLLLSLISNKKVNQRGRLFVIIGRRTLSAAQNMATYFERYTNAIFVGEPTGSSPNFIGEEVPLTLPYSKLIANVSHLFWQSSWPQDQRVWLPPHIYVTPRFADLRARRDAALDAILAAPRR